MWSKGKKVFTAAVLTASLVLATVQPVSANANAEQPPVKELTANNAAAFLDEIFTAEQAKPLFTGAAAVIVKDGKVLAQKGYGYADKEKQVKVDPASTVFRIASVSKTFTAAAIMQLVEQGKIDLKEDFRKYAGELKFDNPFNKPVTVEHLLTHTTGFQVQDVQAEDIHNDFDKVVSIEDYVIANMPPVVREPGSSYMYDNFASLLLGLIIEKVSGEPYETYMDKHLFQPLDMKNSGFLMEGKLKDNMAFSYDAADEKVERFTVTPTVMPHGGMLSTAEDVSKFMIAFLNGGAADTNRILAEKTVKEMEEYRSAIHPLLPDTTYGFEAPFQIAGAGSSSKVITKAGDMIGFSSYLFLIPEQNTGVFITYNKQTALRNVLYAQFINTFFPQYAKPAELAAFTPQSAAALNKYSGLYADLRLKVLVSSLNSNGDKAGTLTISDVFLGQRDLRQVGESLFVDDLTNQFTAFKLDDKGQVSYMKEPYLNPFGYSAKGKQAVGYVDVNEKHLYAEPIFGLQSLGYYANDATKSFKPEESVTRGEYIQQVLETSLASGSKTTEYAFTDLAGHPSAAYIQLGYEMGMVVGDGKGKFEPDRAITRQEAAVMIWRLLSAQYPPALFEDVKLAGETDKWAVPAVQMIVTIGLHGPEVEFKADGSAEFHSKQLLNRQELAAVLYAMFTQPTDHIVAALAAQQAAEQGADEPADVKPAA
ncbi:penicillin-binding protein [Paenibacillaceae bacterium]|nr:penicillin-binding protein [Paenibacillaceae bacterium]